MNVYPGSLPAPQFCPIRPWWGGRPPARSKGSIHPLTLWREFPRAWFHHCGRFKGNPSGNYRQSRCPDGWGADRAIGSIDGFSARRKWDGTTNPVCSWRVLRGAGHRRLPPSNNCFLKGWWGNPWGFESPLRHQMKSEGARRNPSAPFFVSSGAPWGLERARGAERIARKRATYGSPSAKSPAAKAAGLDGQGSGGRVPPSARIMNCI